jgi:hypothetical protein
MWENNNQTFISSTRSTVHQVGTDNSVIQDLNLVDTSSINYKFINGQIIHSPIIVNTPPLHHSNPTSVDSQAYQLISMLSSTITKLRMSSPVFSVSSEQQLVDAQIEKECDIFEKCANKRKKLPIIPLLTKMVELSNGTMQDAINKFRDNQQKVNDIITRTELIKMDITNRINNATNIAEFDDIRQMIKKLDSTLLEELN